MNDCGNASVDALISFGSNLGDRQEFLIAALQRLQIVQGIESVVASDAVITRPVGGPEEQGDFLNVAIRVQTRLSPEALHERLIEIELELGRKRRVRWGSRKIDLDLLLHADHVVVNDQLLIPHPRMSFRRFVLEPANEIAGEMMHPTSGLTISQLLGHLNLMPNVILIVCPVVAQTHWASIMRVVFNSNKFISNWAIEFATPLEFTNQELKPKLVVFDATQLPVELRETISRFRGPTLSFSGQSIDSKAHEFSAAVTAMQSVTG